MAQEQGPELVVSRGGVIRPGRRFGKIGGFSGLKSSKMQETAKKPGILSGLAQ
jgi:hypothetical protein